MRRLKRAEDLGWRDLPNIEARFFARIEVERTFYADRYSSESIDGLDDILREISHAPWDVPRNEQTLRHLLEQVEGGELLLIYEFSHKPFSPVVRWQPSGNASEKGQWVYSPVMNRLGLFAKDRVEALIRTFSPQMAAQMGLPTRPPSILVAPDQKPTEPDVEKKGAVQNLFIGNNRNTPPVPIMQAQPLPSIPASAAAATATEKRCPKCNAVWKKTEPTLAQARNAVVEVSEAHRQDIKAYSADAVFAYLGSVATGVVGNEEKLHCGMEPDIRGECGTSYDIDGLIFSERARTIPKTKGKRWASYNREARQLETKISSSLQSRSELRYMKKGRSAFSLVLYLPMERPKIMAKGCRITVA